MNIYLHYVYDLWVQRWRRRCAQGNVIVVRYADNVVVGFQYLADAHRFLAELKQRLEAFALELHPDKTRIIEFAVQHQPQVAPLAPGSAGASSHAGWP